MVKPLFLFDFLMLFFLLQGKQLNLLLTEFSYLVKLITIKEILNGNALHPITTIL
jgi:hypothetical protein